MEPLEAYEAIKDINEIYLDCCKRYFDELQYENEKLNISQVNTCKKNLEIVSNSLFDSTRKDINFYQPNLKSKTSMVIDKQYENELKSVINEYNAKMQILENLRHDIPNKMMNKQKETINEINKNSIMPIEEPPLNTLTSPRRKDYHRKRYVERLNVRKKKQAKLVDDIVEKNTYNELQAQDIQRIVVLRGALDDGISQVTKLVGNGIKKSQELYVAFENNDNTQ